MSSFEWTVAVTWTGSITRVSERLSTLHPLRDTVRPSQRGDRVDRPRLNQRIHASVPSKRDVPIWPSPSLRHSASLPRTKRRVPFTDCNIYGSESLSVSKALFPPSQRINQPSPRPGFLGGSSVVIDSLSGCRRLGFILQVLSASLYLPPSACLSPVPHSNDRRWIASGSLKLPATQHRTSPLVPERPIFIAYPAGPNGDLHERLVALLGCCFVHFSRRTQIVLLHNPRFALHQRSPSLPVAPVPPLISQLRAGPASVTPSRI